MSEGIPWILFRPAVMNPLQRRLVELGKCPTCKAKLEYRHTGGGMDFHQCTRVGCLRVFVLDEAPKLLG